MGNHTFILIRNSKSSTKHKKFLFKHLINSNSLVVKYIIIIIVIIIFISIKDYAFHFDLSHLKLFGQKRELTF